MQPQCCHRHRNQSADYCLESAELLIPQTVEKHKCVFDFHEINDRWAIKERARRKVRAEKITLQILWAILPASLFTAHMTYNRVVREEENESLECVLRTSSWSHSSSHRRWNHHYCQHQSSWWVNSITIRARQGYPGCMVSIQ